MLHQIHKSHERLRILEKFRNKIWEYWGSVSHKHALLFLINERDMGVLHNYIDLESI